MKKFSIIAGIALSCLMGLTVAGCTPKQKVDPDALKAVEVDPYSLSANYRNLRIKGSGYSGEQFTEKTNEEGQTIYVIEDVKALVVPVDFTDYTWELFGNTEEEVLERVDKIMFGTQEELLEDYTQAELDAGVKPWYSLAAYYKESSFGKCNISGKVMPFFHTGIASTSISKSETGYSKEIALQIQDYYRDSSHGVNLADYDANKDGFIDSIIMLYTAPITTTGELWWAFCWSISGAYGRYFEDGHLHGANRFFWASFNFFYEYYDEAEHEIKYHTPEEIKAGTVHPDAHTMIHEYGHVLSLPDYYVTDYASNDYSGLADLDMMDHNIGDHNAYSKMMYGWVNPRRIDGLHGSLTLTMNSTTKTGDTIIIPAKGEWNNTYLDQYLMIEFLTPEGVAKQDGETKYLNYYPKYYSKAGIRITHVDSRMGVFRSSGFSGYTWMTSAPDQSSYVSIAADNTASRSCYSKYKIIEILPPSGKSIRVTPANLKGDALLYQTGDSFGQDGKWEDFKLNGIDGSQEKEFGFKIHIDAIDGNTSATITISL